MSREFTYTITDPVGIHARPAGKLVKIAQQFESDITLDHSGSTADAKHILGVMSLGIGKGDLLKVSIAGADEDKAAEERAPCYTNYR
ncbi:HPr family phosphocarrier protein [Bifidobacterium aquikefiri]|uniref:HPr family phosphocarrier protein n=1 Tax=Bifidobacterium aquikefiri TaxID=1653207 RepID=UPI0039E92321